MEKLGLLMFLQLVLCAYAQRPVPRLEREYVYVERTLTWYEAREYCRKNYYELFRISDDNNLRNVIGSARQLSWIGLVRWTVNWKWVDDTGAVFLNWYKVGSCAAMTHYGLWFDLPCQNSLPFVCQNGPLKWHFSQWHVNWYGAKYSCNTHSQNFASIWNAVENYNATGGILDIAWIGLSKVTDNTPLKDTWKWTNDQPPTYSNFFTTLFCAAMDRRGFWYDRVCFEKNPFVCFRYNESVPEYKLFSEKKTFSEAQSHCETWGMNLAMVKTLAENTALQLYVSENSEFLQNSLYFWIGLYNDPWFWSEGSSAIRNWNSMEPDGKDFWDQTISNNVQSCVATMDGEWYDEDCLMPRYFFCADKVRSVTLVLEPKSWEEALDHCRDRYVDLASLASDGEQRVAVRRVKDAQSSYVWTGLRFLAGSWFWVYGDDLQYDNWLNGEQPQCPVTRHCGALAVASGKWEARSCEEKLDFICFQE
ncbi:putative C-type mannose receptor 2-like [Triplophysa rosa]|uniref:C-type mannose receptor 2-like n=1 Tax=Triplophysa rosa TaxID=992332 RepID=A0A9W7TFJ5_TRIRA|nr:putative C-type mannose receptor 2-like [Triplophysa rosa]